jgi:hypothetical protein
MPRSAIRRHPPICWLPMPGGFRRQPFSSALSIPVLGERGRRSLSPGITGGISVLAMACSSWFSDGPTRRVVGTSNGSQTAFRPAFTDATSSRRSRPGSRGASRRPVRCGRMMRIADQTGRTISTSRLPRPFRQCPNRKLLEDVLEGLPDRMIARGVPPEFVSLATKKVAAINAAYQELAKERRI